MNSRSFSVLGVFVGVVALLAVSHPVSAAGKDKVLRVGPGQEYATIQAAVVDARHGSRIFVYPGTYTENVFVAKSNLEIIAQGEHVVVLPPGPPAGFLVLADHVTIQGFEIGFGEECAVGIGFEGSHNTFADNFLFQAADCLGVNALVSRDPDGGSDFNTVERNIIKHADLGIVIQATTADAVNTGNIIRDNTLLQIAQTPIAIANGTHFLVSGNRIAGSTYGSCILVGTLLENKIAQGHHRIVENIMAGCADSGISLSAEPGVVLAHNRIADNKIQNSLNGIILSSGADHNQILHNEVRDNTLFGIAVAGNDNVIAGNVALGNAGADLADFGEDNVWRHNTYDTAI